MPTSVNLPPPGGVPIPAAVNDAVVSGVKSLASEAIQQKISSTGEILSQMINRTAETLKPVTDFFRKLWDKIPVPKFLSEFAESSGFNKLGSAAKTGLKFILTAVAILAVGSFGTGYSGIGFLIGAVGGGAYQGMSNSKEVEVNKKKMIGESYAVHYGAAGAILPVVTPILFVIMMFWGSEEKEKQKQQQPNGGVGLHPVVA